MGRRTQVSEATASQATTQCGTGKVCAEVGALEVKVPPPAAVHGSKQRKQALERRAACRFRVCLLRE